MQSISRFSSSLFHAFRPGRIVGLVNETHVTHIACRKDIYKVTNCMNATHRCPAVSAVVGIYAGAVGGSILTLKSSFALSVWWSLIKFEQSLVFLTLSLVVLFPKNVVYLLKPVIYPSACVQRARTARFEKAPCSCCPLKKQPASTCYIT